MTASTTMGKTIRARPVPGAIGLAVRMAPAVRTRPVVLMPPVAVLAAAVTGVPVARKPPVVLMPPVVLVTSSARLPPVVLAGASTGLAPVSRRSGGGIGRTRGGVGSLGCPSVWRTRQDVVHRRPIAGSAHSGGGSCRGGGPSGPPRPGGYRPSGAGGYRPSGERPWLAMALLRPRT